MAGSLPTTVSIHTVWTICIVSVMSSLTCHLVTRNPDAAAAWYTSVLGATETSRITLPGGQVLTIELRFGDSTVAISDEFPDMGVVSPLTLGGTYGALHLAVADADAVWQRALAQGATEFEPLHDAFWGSGPGSSSTRSGTAGRSTSTSRTCRTTRSCGWRPRRSAAARDSRERRLRGPG